MRMHRPGPHVIACTLATSLAALPSCAADADSTVAAYTITDSAGIRIVESRSPLWGDRPLRVQPEPVLRLGKEEEGPEQFSSIAQGIFLGDGRIAVSERSAGEVRLFDSTGLHLRTLGADGRRKGCAPNQVRALRNRVPDRAGHGAPQPHTLLLGSVSVTASGRATGGDIGEVAAG